MIQNSRLTGRQFYSSPTMPVKDTHNVASDQDANISRPVSASLVLAHCSNYLRNYVDETASFLEPILIVSLAARVFTHSGAPSLPLRSFLIFIQHVYRSLDEDGMIGEPYCYQ